jgi:hypothetical protein
MGKILKYEEIKKNEHVLYSVSYDRGMKCILVKQKVSMNMLLTDGIKIIMGKLLDMYQ